jgi:hypothetical protein
VRDNLVPNELLPNYRRFIDKTFGQRARQLGWTAKAGEGAETQAAARQARAAGGAVG